jgi:hypothetical protein
MKYSIKKSMAVMSLAALFTISSQANATLIKRTDNLIYDDVANITWLSDVKYAKTSNFDLDGKMTWADSNAWVEQLSIDGFTNWYLPSLNTNLALVAQDLSLFSNVPTGDAKFWSSSVNENNPLKAYWLQLDGTSNSVLKTAGGRYVFAATNGDVAGQKVDTIVSEPASMAMFSLALAGFAYRRKQIKNSK